MRALKKLTIMIRHLENRSIFLEKDLFICHSDKPRYLFNFQKAAKEIYANELRHAQRKHVLFQYSLSCFFLCVC